MPEDSAYHTGGKFLCTSIGKSCAVKGWEVHEPSTPGTPRTPHSSRQGGDSHSPHTPRKGRDSNLLARTPRFSEHKTEDRDLRGPSIEGGLDERGLDDDRQLSEADFAEDWMRQNVMDALIKAGIVKDPNADPWRSMTAEQLEEVLRSSGLSLSADQITTGNLGAAPWRSWRRLLLAVMTTDQSVRVDAQAQEPDEELDDQELRMDNALREAEEKDREAKEIERLKIIAEREMREREREREIHELDMHDRELQIQMSMYDFPVKGLGVSPPPPPPPPFPLKCRKGPPPNPPTF